MTPFGKILHPEYTDLVVAIGPNVRWTQDDYGDLREERPEVFQGYRVLLTTPDNFDWILGRRPIKFVVFDGVEANPRWLQISQRINGYLEHYDWASVEYWHVHRRIGIWRTA